MLLWIIFAGLTALLLAFILRPLARGAEGAASDEAAFDKAVYRDQLAELKRDTERGLIPASEAEAARNEIGRRLIKADRVTGTGAASSPALRRQALIASVIAIPVFALGVYLWRGSPDVPGVPLAERLANAEANRDLEALIAKVEAHLALNPSDAQGWRTIAPAYRSLGRYDASARAYAQALSHGKPEASLFADMGEVLVMGAQGLVTEAAVQSFDDALKLDAGNPKARYFQALALLQEGRAQEALTLWRALLSQAPADAPWRALIESQIAAAGGEAQDKMIASMVEGLAARLARDGNDLDGWLKLARARLVQGEPDKASEALDRASALFGADARAMARIEELRRRMQPHALP